jgi:hypothetical protein
MKKVFLFLLCLFSFVFNDSKACEIELRIDPASKKEIYKPGDEVVVMVTVTHSHRVCKIDINETKFIPVGLKILAATDWKEVSDGVFQRKMKLHVIGNKSGKLELKATRKCSRENSVGTFKLKCIPLNE